MQDMFEGKVEKNVYLSLCAVLCQRNITTIQFSKDEIN